MTPVIQDLSSWTPRPRPGKAVLAGETVRLEPLDWAVHEAGLFAAVGGSKNAGLWQYVSLGPFENPATFAQDFEAIRVSQDWETLVICDARSGDVRSGAVLGMFSFMRIREQHGSVEIGCVVFGRALQKTRQATEALMLMACHVFEDLAYRRYEWKCDDQNAASMRAAERFGFTYEGTFRNDMVSKGRSRDTAWFSITDAEWPGAKAALVAWLDPSNFDGEGRQIKRLEDIRA